MKKTRRSLKNYNAKTLRSIKIFLACLCLGVLMSLVSCSKPEPKPSLTLSEANQKFLKLCREDYNLDPKVKFLGNTVHIYLPLEHDIISLKANGFPRISQNGEKKRNILFLNAIFQDNSFIISYHIQPFKKYAIDQGYGSTYDQRYTKKQRFLMQALTRAYNELDQEDAPGDINYYDARKQETHKEVVRFKPIKNSPDFIVVTITDVKKGIETTTTFHYTDYKYISMGRLPMDEYFKRIISSAGGNINAIGDHAGEHVNYKDITWPEFIAKQITNRIKFKYEQSGFPPTTADKDEILKVVNEAINAYNFDNFETVRLENLADGDVMVFEKEQLETFKDSI